MNIFYLYIDEFYTTGKISKYHHEAGRYILEYVAKNFYKIENSELEIVNDKPKFKHSNIKFSISHSNNIAAVCFDENEVGLDIEYIKKRDYKSIAKRMDFNLKEDSLNAFYECWTQYEAEYKLGCKFKTIKTQLFQKEYLLSVASVNEIQKINIYKICLSKFCDKPAGCERNLRAVTSKCEHYDCSDKEAAESDTRLN